MRPTRRQFMRRAGLSIIAANLPLNMFAQRSFKKPSQDWAPERLALFDGVSAQTFEPWIGSQFRVSLNGHARGSILLLSVDEIGAETAKEPDNESFVRRAGPVLRPSNGPAITSFSLHFQGSGAVLPQDTYMLAHDWLGNFPLFIVPSGLSGARSTYTAVFTLLPRTGSTEQR